MPAAESGAIADSQSTRMEATVQGAGTLTLYWKVSSESGYDYLEFWLDGVRQDRISGDVDREQKSYNLTGSGTHTLKWQYIKDSSADDGSDCGWVDYVQWSGATTPVYTPIPEDWDTVTYTYDADGRRVAKAFDGQTCLKYVYDGDQCIAEYDGNNNLLRKYIYGPGIDQPISMIDVKDGNATWYYHFDALGSVVALSDANGDTAEVYEYSVYGQVAASDPNHMNLFMFTGREFDKETGLYYYRARYYDPEIGRFVQTDPVGYQGGMNLYRYCQNNPVTLVDPFGRDPCGCNDVNDGNDHNSPGITPPAPAPPARPDPPAPPGPPDPCDPCAPCDPCSPSTEFSASDAGTLSNSNKSCKDRCDDAYSKAMGTGGKCNKTCKGTAKDGTSNTIRCADWARHYRDKCKDACSEKEAMGRGNDPGPGQCFGRNMDDVYRKCKRNEMDWPGPPKRN